MESIVRLLIDRMDTPLGELILVADLEGRLRAVDWADHDGRLPQKLRRAHGEGGFALEPRRDPNGLTAALAAYFKGDLGALEDLPVAGVGTPFQREVWAALREIPCGTTLSYGELARRIDRPAAVRAVGLANGANPIGIVVPCHRVIGSNGALTGFAGGIERKRWLLVHESAARVSVPRSPIALPLPFAIN
jgi:methylated-DNA-[protein]-cysteine S-methyltransferase